MHVVYVVVEVQIAPADANLGTIRLFMKLYRLSAKVVEFDGWRTFRNQTGEILGEFYDSLRLWRYIHNVRDHSP